MPSASITFTPAGGAAYEFHTNGRAQFGRTTRFEADAQVGAPRRGISTYTIQEWFSEPSFADNQARLSALTAALRCSEGVLLILDENQREIANVRVRPEQHNLPEQWAQYFLETTVSFIAREEIAATSPGAATFQPNGTGAAITLENPSDWKEIIRTERPSTAASWRRETIVTITATGKIHANPNDAELTRRQFLEAQKQRIEAANDCKDGLLRWAYEAGPPEKGFSKTVRLESFEADVIDADTLAWSLSAFYRRFPDGDFANAELSYSQKEDIDRHEVVTSLKGRIRAGTEAAARVKAAALRDVYASGSLRIIGSDAQQLSGVDGEAFTELTFDYEWRAVSTAGASYKLTVTDKTELRAGTIITTYAGTVTAADSAAALTKARQLGDNKYPFRISSTETIGTTSTGGDAAQFQEVSFSYEYQRAGTWQFAEVNGETSVETFGASTSVVSGFTVAATESDALTLARSFQIGGRLLRSSREVPSNYHKGSDALFIKVDFHYTYHLGAAVSAISYRVKTSVDYSARETITTYSGSAWGAAESDADGLITTLVSGLSGRKVADERESSFDKSGSITAFLSRSFNVTRAVPLAAGGDDILEGEWSLDSVGSINHAVLTPIPYGTANVQTGVGTTIGTKTVSGSVVSITQATGVTWGQAKRTYAESGGYAQAPQEKKGTVYYPMSGTSIKAYRFSFTYSAQFTNLVL